MNCIYLDHAATGPLNPVVKDHLLEAYSRYGNPASPHALGWSTRHQVEDCRTSIANNLGCEPRSIYFCAGATEAANLTILGLAASLRSRGQMHKTFYCSAVEHLAVYSPMSRLATFGMQHSVIPVNAAGIVDPKMIEATVSSDAACVAIMGVNNETGAMSNISALASAIRHQAQDAVFICDLAQMAGKFPIYLKKWGVDIGFISAHKFGGPKGVGAFYVNDDVQIEPMLYGGNQESGFRPGTINVPGIELMTLALAEACCELESHEGQVARLRQRVLSGLCEKNIQYEQVVPSEGTSPYILSLVFPGFRAQSLLDELSKRMVFVSQRSACSSNSHTKSRVFEAIGLSPFRIDSVLRLSFGTMSTENDVDAFLNALVNVMDELRKTR